MRNIRQGWKHIGVSAEDDMMHVPPKNTKNWSESTMVVANDPASGVAVMTHFLMISNEPAIWEGAFAAFLPGGDILVSRSFGKADPGGPFQTGELRCAPIVPLESWELRFEGMVRRISRAEAAAGPITDGPVEAARVDLRIEATSAAFGIGSDTGGDKTLANSLKDQTWGKMHIEQTCRMVGSLESKETTFPINCVGHRDRSAGPRVLPVIYRESWVNGAFPDGKSFHLFDYYTESHPPHGHGFIWDGSRLHMMTETDGPRLTTAYGDPTNFEIRFTTALGSEIIQGEVMNSHAFALTLPIGQSNGAPLKGCTLLEGPARYTWKGQVGHGWAERAFVK